MTRKKKTPPAPRRIELVPLDEVQEAAVNPKRHHSDLGASIGRFGFADAPILDERTGRLVAGHGRLGQLRAMVERGETPPEGITQDERGVWLVPLQRGWSSRSDEEAAAFLVAHNRIGEAGGWDDAQLAELLGGLGDAEVEGLGFLDGEVQEILDAVEPEPTDDPGAGEPPEEPASERGEVYALGPHRLMCGDCREPADWAKLVGAEKVNVCVTSPPYASQRKYDESSGFKPIHPDAYVDWWEPLQALVAQYLADDGSFFVNIKEHCEDGQRSLYVKDLTLAHVRQWGWLFVDEFCWKRHGVPGRWANRFKNAWEPVFHFSRSKSIKLDAESVGHASEDCISYSPDNTKTHSGFLSAGGGENGRKAGIALPGNVLEIAQAHSDPERGHTAEFPVGLPEFFVNAFSDEGDLIMDPFLGSGTTLIAAARQGRRCYGLEISPAYCDVIRKRWGDYARDAGVDPGPDAL